MKKFVICFLIVMLCLVSFASAITFSDLEGYDSIYVEAITNLSEKGVINGYPDGSYMPENNVTRAELIKIIVCAFEMELKEGNNISYAFDDVKGKWCEEYVKIGVSNNLLKGYEDGTFRPQNNVTYGELSAIVCRVLGFDVDVNVSEDWATPYINYLGEKDIFAGIPSDELVSSNKARRGTVALIVYNALKETQKPVVTIEPTTPPTIAPTVPSTVQPTVKPTEEPKDITETDLSMFKEGQIYCGRVSLELNRAGVDYVVVDCFEQGEVTFTVKKIDKKPHYNSLILFRVRSSGKVSLIKELKQVNVDLDDYLLVESVSGSLVGFKGSAETLDLDLDEYVLKGNKIRIDKYDFFLVEMELDKKDEYIFSDAKQVNVNELKAKEDDRFIFDTTNSLCFVIRGIETED